MKFAKEARPFVLPFVAAAAGLAVAGKRGWAGAAGLTGLGVLLFFRDPSRHCDEGSEVVAAAADGVVTRVDTVEDPEVGPGRFRRVVTFLSVLDVHVQRTPVAGEVVYSGLTRGRKVAAFRDDAGDVNERHLTVIRRDSGDLVGVRQIAGLLARRVVPYLREGQIVERGQHLGVIKFGSRVDLLLPESYRVLAKKGDRLKNGESPVAIGPGV